MANAWYLNYTGGEDVTAPTLGDLTGKTLKVVSQNVRILATDNAGYWFSQASSTLSSRECGIFMSSANGLAFYALGTNNTTILTPPEIAAEFGSTIIETDLFEFNVDYSTGAYQFLNNGVVFKSGTLSVGSSRVDGVLFRLGSRGANDTAGSTASGYVVNDMHIGNTQVYVDGVLERNYVSDGTGNTWEEVQNSQDGTLQNFPTNDTQWVLYDDGTGGALNITGATTNYSYSPVSATIDLTSEIAITGQTANYTYAPISASVDLTGEIAVTGQTSSYSYTAQSGTVEFVSVISVTGQTQSFSYAPVNANVELTGEITVNGQTTSYNYVSVPGTVLLQGTIVVTGETASYSYNAVLASVSLNALEPVVQFFGHVKQSQFSGTIKESVFTGSINQSQFSGKIKQSAFSGVRR